MTFFTVVIRGLWRRPLRTGLTLAGISIGIAAVVALVGMSRGFEKGWQAGLKARGTDIVVTSREGSLTPKPFDASIRDHIASLPRIAATCNILVEVTSVEDSDLMILSAREWGCFAWNNLELVSGRMPRDAAEETVVLGQTAADSRLLKDEFGGLFGRLAFDAHPFHEIVKPFKHGEGCLRVLLLDAREVRQVDGGAARVGGERSIVALGDAQPRPATMSRNGRQTHGPDDREAQWWGSHDRAVTVPPRCRCILISVVSQHMLTARTPCVSSL